MNATALLQAMNICAPSLTGTVRVHLCRDDCVKAPPLPPKPLTDCRVKWRDLKAENRRIRMNEILTAIRTIRPREVSINQLAVTFSYHRGTINNYCNALWKQGLLTRSERLRYIFYYSASDNLGVVK